MKKKTAAKKPKIVKRKKTAKAKPEFVGKTSGGAALTKTQDKEYRRQMNWPAR